LPVTREEIKIQKTELPDLRGNMHTHTHTEALPEDCSAYFINLIISSWQNPMETTVMP